jgi:hypothetical protein
MDPELNAQFDREIVSRLRQLCRRVKWYVLADGLASVAMVFIGLCAIQLMLDRWLRLPVDMRAALAGAIVLTLGWLMIQRLWRPLRVNIGLNDAAQLVEQHFDQLNDQLISAVEFAGERDPAKKPWSPSLVQSVIGQALSATRSIPMESALNHQRAARRAGIVAGVALVFIAVSIASPLMMGLWFQRNVMFRDVDWPKRTHISILGLADGQLRHLQEEDLAIQAEVRGDLPRQMRVEFRFTDGQSGTELMAKSGGTRFTALLRRIEEPLEFRVSGGDDVTDWVPVELVEPPRITSLSIAIDPPAYAKLDPLELREGQAVAEVLRGSKVTVRISANKTMQEVQLLQGRSPIAQAQRLDDRRWSVTIEPTQTAAYQFDLLDLEGFRSKKPTRFSIRVVPDEPPKVTLKLPGVGGMVVPEAVLPVELEMRDRYGLAQGNLVVRNDADPPVEKRMAATDWIPNAKQYDKTFAWNLTDVEPQVQQRLVVWAEATDHDNVAGPNLGESSKFTLLIVTQEELLAELARREQEYRRDFERLLTDQEELRLALLEVLPPDQTRSVETIAGLERRQRQYSVRAKTVGQQFGRVLREMQINQMSSSQVRERLGRGVVEPLDRLATGPMVEAANDLKSLLTEDAAGDRNALDRRQAEILDQMRSILANMVKWEGYQEVVALLRDVIQLQEETRKETKSVSDSSLDDVFESDAGTSTPKK